MDLNKHILAYLDYYVSFKIPPNFAVLINGKWGSGKSWFIKNYVQNKAVTDPSTKYLYVSLYGISSFAEIEDIFFKELNPFFAKPAMRVAGALFKGILKSTIKVDFDLTGDQKSDMSVSGNGGDVSIKIFKSVEEQKNCVLIFDDLERCEMDIVKIMGYINQFVENDGLKAIIIANEEEIFKTENTNLPPGKSYRLIKEKLIGRSFEITSDVDMAIADFIKQLQNQDIQTLLTKFKPQIRGVYETANYNNLRHLRQSILDFERFYSLLPVDCLSKDDLAKNIIQTFLSISIELKKGDLKEENIVELFRGPLVRRRDNNDPIKRIHLKYAAFSQFDKVIYPLSWSEYFKKGIESKETLKIAIYGSIYYYDENTPNWKKLSNFYSLTQTEFDQLFTNVYSEFENHAIMNIAELVTVVALFLFFSKVGIITISKDTIIEKAREQTNTLQAIGSLKREFVLSSVTDIARSLDGQVYYTEEFSEFFNWLKMQIDANRSALLKKRAHKLLEVLTSSAQKFDEQLFDNRSDVFRYFDTPILAFIEIPDIITVFWQLSPTDRNALGVTLQERYKHTDINQKLADELPWLQHVNELIAKENRERNEKLTEYLVEKKFLKSLKLAIELLEKSLT